MPITATLSVNRNQIQVAIQNALVRYMNTSLLIAAQRVEVALQDLISNLMEGSDTYQSILAGELRSEFGLINPQHPLEAIVDTLRGSVTVMVIPAKITGSTVHGGIRIGMIRQGFQDLLSLSEASYMSNEHEVTWLDWLLTQGDNIIIMDYVIDRSLTPEEQQRSRTGEALMKEGPQGWRVPSGFSGVVSENWITKVFNTPLIQTVVADAVRRSFV